MHIIQAEIGIPQVLIDELGANHVLFTIEPLPPGYATTLGNALRRVLLSSIPGAAITGVKIDGVRHEYTSIPGVQDSVLDFILKLKRVHFKKEDVEKSILRLSVTNRKGAVTGGDIDCPPGVTVMNPDEVITHLDKKSTKLDVEIHLEKGVGAIEVDQESNTDPDLILTNAIFTPLRKVRYTVTKARVGQMTNLDKLQLEVQTNGSFDAKESVRFAADILTSYFGFFNTTGSLTDAAFMSTAQDIVAKQQVDEEKSQKTVYTPIEILNFSPRTLNALINGGIGSIEQLTQCTEAKLGNLRGFGKKAMDEVKEALEKRGLSLLEE